MAVPAVNIVIEQGTDFTEVFNVKNKDASVVDLTGNTGVAKIRKFPESIDYTSFNVGIVSATGQITVSLANTISSDLKSGRYYYDIVTISSSGIRTKRFDGMVLVRDTQSL